MRCDAGMQSDKQEVCCVCGLPTAWLWLRILPSATRWSVGLSARGGRHGYLHRSAWSVLTGTALRRREPPGSFPTTVMTRCWHTQERQGKPQALRHVRPAPLAAGTRWSTDTKGTQERAQRGRRDAIERRRDTALVARLDEPLEGVIVCVSMPLVHLRRYDAADGWPTGQREDAHFAETCGRRNNSGR
jgi:hypothetical protein